MAPLQLAQLEQLAIQMLTPSKGRLRVPDLRRIRPTYTHPVERSSGPFDSHAQRCPRLFALCEDILILTTQKSI